VEERDWDGARATLADDFECVWPHTGERFTSPDAYIAVNRAFPDNWHVELLRLGVEGDLAVAEVRVPTDDGGSSFCSGWYELRDGLIARATEYWVDADPGAVPEWRKNMTFNN
jgi:hypothetical protein